MLAGHIAVTVCGSIVAVISVLTGNLMAFSGQSGTVAGATGVTVTGLAWAGLLTLCYRLFRRIDFVRSEFTPRLATIAGRLLVVSRIIAWGGRITQLQIVGPAWFREAAIWSSFDGLAIHAGVYATLLAAMYQLSKSMIGASE